MGDSFYEYLIKTWYLPSSCCCTDMAKLTRMGASLHVPRLLADKKHDMFYRMYVESAEAIRKHLVQTSQPSGLTYIAERRGSVKDPKMDHLACFAGMPVQRMQEKNIVTWWRNRGHVRVGLTSPSPGAR